MSVDALFVDAKGIYPRLLGAEHCWDEKRDARTYAGEGPVVSRATVDQNPRGYWDGFVCEVWQSAYGHLARKRTWLLYCGKRPPFELNWTREPGTHQCGWFDRNKPTVSKREACATPERFARELIKLAEWSRG